MSNSEEPAFLTNSRHQVTDANITTKFNAYETHGYDYLNNEVDQKNNAKSVCLANTSGSTTVGINQTLSSPIDSIVGTPFVNNTIVNSAQQSAVALSPSAISTDFPVLNPAILIAATPPQLSAADQKLKEIEEKQRAAAAAYSRAAAMRCSVNNEYHNRNNNSSSSSNSNDNIYKQSSNNSCSSVSLNTVKVKNTMQPDVVKDTKQLNTTNTTIASNATNISLKVSSHTLLQQQLQTQHCSSSSQSVISIASSSISSASSPSPSSLSSSVTMEQTASSNNRRERRHSIPSAKAAAAAANTSVNYSNNNNSSNSNKRKASSTTVSPSNNNKPVATKPLSTISTSGKKINSGNVNSKASTHTKHVEGKKDCSSARSNILLVGTSRINYSLEVKTNQEKLYQACKDLCLNKSTNDAVNLFSKAVFLKKEGILLNINNITRLILIYLLFTTSTGRANVDVIVNSGAFDYMLNVVHAGSYLNCNDAKTNSVRNIVC